MEVVLDHIPIASTSTSLYSQVNATPGGGTLLNVDPGTKNREALTFRTMNLIHKAVYPLAQDDLSRDYPNWYRYLPGVLLQIAGYSEDPVCGVPNNEIGRSAYRLGLE